MPLGLLAFITIPLGLAFSIVAIIVYEWLWPSNLKCDMSIVAFPIMELMILTFTTPIIYFVYRAKCHSKRAEQKNDQQLLTPGH